MARVLCVKYPAYFIMSLIATMPAMGFFLKASYSLESHPSQDSNRALLLSLQQLSGFSRPGQGAKIPWVLANKKLVLL